MTTYQYTAIKAGGKKMGRTNMLSMLLEGIGRMNHFEFLSSFPSGVKQNSLSSSWVVFQEPDHQLCSSKGPGELTKYSPGLYHRSQPKYPLWYYA
jgi:hypothetical protein